VSPWALRPARAEDKPFLYALYASTRDDEMALVDWSEPQKESFLRTQFEAQHSYYTGHFCTAQFEVVEQRQQPIGRFYVDRRENEIRVIDIALLPTFRQRGIGTALMQGVMNEAAQTEKPVTIHVEQFNSAMRFYQRLGFQAVCLEGMHWLMEWRASSEARAAPRPTGSPPYVHSL
jgi:ribosomal protein S18 acetylase RimI-like enzyme